MQITQQSINNMNPDELAKTTLYQRWGFVVKICKKGIGLRMGKLFFHSNSYISMIAKEPSKNEKIAAFLNEFTLKIAQTYINNNDITKDELLLLEESFKAEYFSEIK